MKKRFVSCSLMVACIIAACNNDPKASTSTTAVTPEASTTTAPDLSKNPDYQHGLELSAKSDCATCHRINEKVTGPSFSDIANKYAGMPDTIVTHLAGKIIKGGSGVWGQVMMTPHPTVSQADAEAMVKYILLLKQQ
jgi:cytochrome c